MPKNDPLTYEKPLPLELLPFAIREAAHLPIGTAFCIGRNQYVSAAHVIAAGAGSQFGAPKVRDQAGHVYEIAEVLGFSLSEDFAVFSLQGAPDQDPLPVNQASEPNSTVFAVGNALGEGIVIRDGLFTSSTPEQLEGRWNWIRFSAATSPGNSGGPLLDKKGRVIGVVIAKSPNENLNFALPISRVLSPSMGRARFESRSSFSLPFAPESIVVNSNEGFDLPLSYGKFAEAALALTRRIFDQARANLLQENSAKYFPKGEESRQLLFTQPMAVQPRLIVRRDTKWEAKESDENERSDLGKGGLFVGGIVADTGVARIWLPEDIKLKDLVADSRKFMELFLRGSALKRFVGPEGVRISSLGPAQQDTILTDAYQRKWLLRVWNVPYMDAQLISLALPVPDGFVTLSRFGPTALAYPTTELLKMAADLVYVTYSGTLDRWRDYMAMTSIQPAILSGISIDFEPGEYFHYVSARLDLSLNTDLQNITGDGLLHLNFSYFEDHGAIVWDVSGLHFQEDAKGATWVHVIRHSRPLDSMEQGYKDEWDQLRGHRKPYDSVPFAQDQTMYVKTSVTRSAGPESVINPDTPLIYEAGYAVKSYFSPDEMRSMRISLVKGLHILEP